MKSQMHTHIHENNSESLQHLEENEQYLSDQCMLVWKLLKCGIRLTVVSAITKYGISSLPRRIKDLRDRNGKTEIEDEWVLNGDGKKLFKEWFIPIPKPPTKQSVTQSYQQLSLM